MQKLSFLFFFLLIFIGVITAQRPLFFAVTDPHPELLFSNQFGSSIQAIDSFYYVSAGYLRPNNKRVANFFKVDLNGNLVKSIDVFGTQDDIGIPARPIYEPDNGMIVFPIGNTLFNNNGSPLTGDGGFVRFDTSLIIDLLKFYTDIEVETAWAYSIIKTKDEDYLLNVGMRNGGFGYSDEVLKCDYDGNIIWKIEIPNDTLDFRYPFEIISLTDGNFMLLSRMVYTQGFPPFGFRDTPILTKFNTDGDVLWQKIMPAVFSGLGSPCSITPMLNGDIAYLFITDSLPLENVEPLRLYCLDSFANIKWQVDWRTYEGAKVINKIAITKAGDILGCGTITGGTTTTGSKLFNVQYLRQASFTGV